MATANASARNFIPMQNKYDRVIILVDMDCFYCQVEEKLNPQLKGQPMAVVQYNAWRGGGIIAVNYAARANGVTRHMRGDEAKGQCPEIQLVKVPNIREKADLSKYREAGKEVAQVLQGFTALLERASVDEAYLDITEAVNKRLEQMNAGTFILQPQELINTYAVGYERIGDYLKVITAQFANPYGDDEALSQLYEPTDLPAVRQSDVRLLLGASIASQIRAAVKAKTGYECSAGIAHNKILAKLACGMNKPNKQTILPLGQVEKLFDTLPVGKIKGLGAKFGDEVCERLKIRSLGHMLKYTESELQKKFDEKNGSWLYYICRGIDLEAVTPRFYSKSIGCCKKFPGRNNITGLNTLKHWLSELATEIAERLEKDICENNRKAKQMTVSFIQEFNGEEVSSSRSLPLLCYEQEALTQRSLEVIKTNTKQFFRPDSDAVLNNPIKFLGISVGKFETISSGQTKLQEMFANQVMKKRKSDNENINETIKESEQRVEQLKNEEESIFEKKKEQQNSIVATDLQIKTENIDEATFKSNAETNSTNHSKPTIKQSFFKNALSRSVQPAAETVEVINPSDATSLDDVLKLEAELRAIDEENANNIPDSHGSPERKKIRLTPELQNNDTNEIPASTYQAQYAEYAVPELRIDLLEFQKCDLCGMKVPVEARAQQEHLDHHFAQQLSQQQREEFRTEVKLKITQNNSPPQQQQQRKSKQSNNQPSKKSNKSLNTSAAQTPAAENITKFLKAKSPPPANSEKPSTSSATAANGEQIPCEECKLLINAADLSEHQDFHLAKQLQRQLNQLKVHTVPIAKKGNRSSASIAKNSITQFFTQSN